VNPLADLEEFVSSHRAHGTMTADATQPAWNGYLLTGVFVGMRRRALPAPLFLGAQLVGEFELGDSVHTFDNLTDPVDRTEYIVNPLT
jgi:hypothetical protein